jgi:RNA polymerase sigma-70 factor, ECF subfamily
MFETISHVEPTYSSLAHAFGPPRPDAALVLGLPSLEEISDEALLEAVGRWSDHAAFEAIYARHIGAVNAVARQVCRKRAAVEEIAQHTFMGLWQRAERLAAKSVRLRPWLVTVARNAAIDYVRSGHAATVLLEEATDRPSQEIGPERALLDGESHDALHGGLAALSPQQCEVIELVYFQGLTYQAVADATGEPLGTVKSRVRLALKHLRDLMSDAL